MKIICILAFTVLVGGKPDVHVERLPGIELRQVNDATVYVDFSEAFSSLGIVPVEPLVRYVDQNACLYPEPMPKP